MNNAAIARIFTEIADLMEISGGDLFRINSYRKSARVIEDLAEDVEVLVRQERLLKVAGIGKGTAQRVCEYLETGKIGLHLELLASLPATLPELLKVPGLGPKKANVLYHELGICSIDDLRAAIQAGTVQQLKGFGSKTADKLLAGTEFLACAAGRMPLGTAVPIAELFKNQLAAMAGVQRVEVAGSLRRGKDLPGDIDLLCVADDGARITQAFTALPQVAKVLAAGDTKASIALSNPEGGDFQVDLRVVPAESFGAAWQYFTGSKEHNVRLRERAVKRGWLLNEYGLFDGQRQLAGADEQTIYQLLELPWIPPELREDRGEIEQADRLPRLLELGDIRGDLHMHTPASDGRSSIENMIAAALRKGYKYIAITDHSQSSVIAGGMKVDALLEHAERVRKLNQQHPDLLILAGTECDILSDGSLDYTNEVLAQLDWVIASIHAAQSQSPEQLTRRTLAAIENPHVDAIGHPSGRLLCRRDAMEMDWSTIFAAAARTGTALEISASYLRLDLKDVHVRQAIEAGCMLVINTDAHDVSQLDQMAYGVITARRGWAGPDMVLNTREPMDMENWLASSHKS